MNLTRMLKFFGLPVLAMALLAGVLLHTLRQRVSTGDFILVERRVAADLLHERGFLESAAVSPVQLGANGEIREMARDGARVTAGQIVARIDETAYLERLANLEVEIETSETTLAIRQAERAAAEEDISDSLVLGSNRLHLAQMELAYIQRGLTADERRELKTTCELREIECAEAEDAVIRERAWVADGLASVATLEDTERRLESARAALEEARIEYDIQTGPPLAETLLEGVRTVERLQGELRRGHRAGERRLAKAAAEIDEARALLQLNRVDYGQTSNEWANCAVAAPTSGVFRARMFSDWRQGGVWQTIKPGVTRGRLDRIADIVQPGEMQVQIMLHESDIERVATGMVVRVHVPALGTDRLFQGVLHTVGGVGRDRYDVAPRGVERAVSGVTVFNASIRLPVSDPAFRPGMSVLASIEREPERERLLIPRESVDRDTAGDRVRLADGQARAVVGRFFGSRLYEVSAGLQAGDQIQRCFIEGQP